MEDMMNNVELDEVIEVFQKNNKANGLGWGMIGGAIVAGVVTLGVLAKKKYDNHKAKKSEGVLKFENNEGETKDEEVTIE